MLAAASRTLSLAVLFAMPFATRESAAQRPKDQPPVLTALVINTGVDTVSAAEPSVALVPTIVGVRPSEYRVSRRADFAGAQWLAYTERIVVRDWYDATGPYCDASRQSHRAAVYFQVRAVLGTEVRVVDGQRQVVPARVESNVLRASVCAHTA